MDLPSITSLACMAVTQLSASQKHSCESSRPTSETLTTCCPKGFQHSQAQIPLFQITSLACVFQYLGHPLQLNSFLLALWK